jgi:hypothetical protein
VQSYCESQRHQEDKQQEDGEQQLDILGGWKTKTTFCKTKGKLKNKENKLQFKYLVSSPAHIPQDYDPTSME